MSRTTHDINLDHHGTLESSRIEQGVLSTVAVGAVFGQYYGTESLVDVFMSLDERLTAISHGYNIVADRFDLGSWIVSVPTDDVSADSVIISEATDDVSADSYFDPAIPGTKERTFLTAEAEIE